MPQFLKFKSKVFNYSGSLDDSKSIVNRLLIAQFYKKDLTIEYQSQADDVIFLEKAISDLNLGKTHFDLGSGGTTFRFFLGLLSRTKGHYTVKAHSQLLARPHGDLFSALEQLGTKILKCDSETIEVTAVGWNNVGRISVNSNQSSQFLSAILLNAWNLDYALIIKTSEQIASRSFLKMTEEIVQQLGMQLQIRAGEFELPANQSPLKSVIKAEVDASSLFTLACFAILFGSLDIRPYQNLFGQPDFDFLKYFSSWKINFLCDVDFFRISKQKLPSSVEINIQNAPDLFPVLCAFLSFCEGEHKVYGAPQLVNKESNRIEKTFELLKLCGVAATKLADGLIVQGSSNRQPTRFKFNPDNDHRMAFAAALFAFSGYEVELQDRHVVNKSFTGFWKILGLLDA